MSQLNMVMKTSFQIFELLCE